MDQIMPIQFIKQNLDTKLKQLTEIHKSGSSAYYSAVTQYGNMSLIIENYTGKIGQQDTLQFLQNRKCFMKQLYNIFPLIYEQKISINHPDQIICVSLIEQCLSFEQYLNSSNNINKTRINQFENLLSILNKMQMQSSSLDYSYKGDIRIEQLYYFVNSDRINLDFTKIVPSGGLGYNFDFVQKVVDLFLSVFQHKATRVDQIKQLSLIHDKIYAFAPQRLRKARSLLELMIMLNFCGELTVQVELIRSNKNKHEVAPDSPKKLQRMKKVSVRQLQGNQIFWIKDDQYRQLHFVDGKCISCFVQISEMEQKNYIRANYHYRIRKLQNLYVEYKQILRSQEQQIEDKITVFSPVQKIQFISFIIYYLRAIEPVINSISYFQHENSLKIQYISKQKKPRCLKIIFYHNYIIKDEEVSMILQRAKLKYCRLDLRFMKINDTFLMFLANSEKTLKIIQLHLSDCYGLTDNGINTLLVSPFCKNLQIISLILDDGLFASSVQSLNAKSDLKKLYIERNSYNQEHHHKTQIDISKMKLTDLSSIGIKISLSNLNAQFLKVLKITQPISLDELKYIKNLRLTELKLKIYQVNKKSIIQSTSSFLSGTLIGKNQNPIRSFSQGPSDKTLKILDLSQSSIKFKTCKYFFWMSQLQSLSLDSCVLGNQFQPISAKILHLSLSNTQISIQNLETMTSKTPILVELNLIDNSTMSRQDLYKYVNNKKQIINNLVVCQKCYSNKLIERSNLQKGIEYVENVCLSVARLLTMEMQDVLFSILFKVMQTHKILKMYTSFRKDISRNHQQENQLLQTLMHKIQKFLLMSSKEVKDLKNLSINNQRFDYLYSLKLQKRQINERQKNLSNEIEIISKNGRNIVKICADKDEKIDKLAYKIVSTMQKYPDSALTLYLQNNRLIEHQILKLLAQFCRHNVNELNFQNCIFSCTEVVHQLLQFDCLQIVNEGHLELQLNASNFAFYSQKYLKFFMMLRFVCRLTIKCKSVQESEILYSILYHIVDKHSHQLQKITLQFEDATLNNEIEMLFNKILQLPNLQQLTLVIDSLVNQKRDKAYKLNCFSNINHLKKIKKLSLKIPFVYLLPISNKYLQQLSLDLSGQQIQQNDLHKILKNIHLCQIKSLSLDLSNCSQLTSPHKIFSLPNSSILQKLPSLKTLNLNFEQQVLLYYHSCPLKDHSLVQLLQFIPNCNQLNKITLNVSFAVSNVQELISAVCKVVIDAGRDLNIFVYAVTANSKDATYNRDFCFHNGIQFLL